jgi:hypothetical protein
VARGRCGVARTGSMSSSDSSGVRSRIGLGAGLVTGRLAFLGCGAAGLDVVRGLERGGVAFWTAGSGFWTGAAGSSAA